jgi:nicotinamidase-related amidase
MPRTLCLLSLALFVSLAPADKPAAKSDTLSLNLRSRVEAFKGSGEFDEVTIKKDLPAKKTALVICDVWDKHWCESASKRCDAIAKKADPVVAALRKKGVTIIHCPSDCMDYYKDSAQRKAAQSANKATPPKERDLPDPPLPIDDKDGGCDDEKPAKSYRAWKKQHDAIKIADGDFVTDQGAEVYNILKARGIENLLVMGVHTNMCVLNRTFAIKKMTRWGVKCVLVRDLTDAMYDPKKKPFVSHDEGTQLVIKHIEKHWCPTVLSEQLGK